MHPCITHIHSIHTYIHTHIHTYIKYIHEYMHTYIRYMYAFQTYINTSHSSKHYMHYIHTLHTLHAYIQTSHTSATVLYARCWRVASLRATVKHYLCLFTVESLLLPYSYPLTYIIQLYLNFYYFSFFSDSYDLTFY